MLIFVRVLFDVLWVPFSHFVRGAVVTALRPQYSSIGLFLSVSADLWIFLARCVVAARTPSSSFDLLFMILIIDGLQLYHHNLVYFFC